MSYIILTYDHNAKCVTHVSFEDQREALADLRIREAAAAPHEEVVLFSSDSLETLKRTHSRYFYTLEEMEELTISWYRDSLKDLGTRIEALRDPLPVADSAPATAD